MAEALAVVASGIAVAQTADRVVSLLGPYIMQVKHAKEEIENLSAEVRDLGKVLKAVNRSAEGSSYELDQEIKQCESALKKIQSRLDQDSTSKTRKLVSRISSRLVWPFKSGEVKEIINQLERRKSNLSLCLSADGADDRITTTINGLPYAAEAEISEHKRAKPHCLPDTRVKLLQDIFQWNNNPSSPTIFWLKGMAGTGKSTVARTFGAKAAEVEQNLVVSFCFSRGTGDLERSTKVFTTIARELATRSKSRYPTLRSQISKAISKDPELPQKGQKGQNGLSKQWEHLILEPLTVLDKVLKSPLPIILVLDALDECKDKKDIQLILKLLPQVNRFKRIQFRVFATSRPETTIVSGFEKVAEEDLKNFTLHHIEHSITDGDIKKYVKHEFNHIRDKLGYKNGWPPGEDKVNLLVSRASHLFIYASTACLFILKSRYSHPSESLELLLRDAPGTTTIEDMNKLYETVLVESVLRDSTGSLAEGLAAKFRKFVGPLVVALDILPRQSYFQLVGATGTIGEVLTKILEDLRSVLEVPEDSKSPIQLLHPSFRDFLVTKGRASDRFLINEADTHQWLAGRCLDLMASGLENNMCKLGPGCSPSTVSREDLEKAVSPELQYACRYWVEHVQRSRVSLTDDDKNHPQSPQIHRFFRRNLLQWLEALSLIGRLPDAVRMIYTLESMVQAESSPYLRTIVYDAKKFILQSRQIIEQAPIQTYCSALAFAPMKSIVRKQFSDGAHRWIRRLPKVENNWDASLQTLEGHSGPVRAVAFSPDGRLLASASEDETVRLWDAGSGEAKQTLEGHSGWVRAVAFSPDGRLLASASDDNTVRLWDAGSGEVKQTLEGHSGWVLAVAFSPDGRLLASASSDETVRLWDAGSGEAKQTLEGHSGWVRAVAFSPDGRLLASASDDNTVRLWDAGSGEAKQTLEGHSGWVLAVAFSPDGRLLASASSDETVRLWDAGSGEAKQTLEGHSGPVRAVAFSPDGRLLASASEDETVRLWDAGSGEVKQTLEGHSGPVRAVAFSPDGRLLASASDDKTVRLWDAGSGEAKQTLEGHSGWVRAVAFSPDGRLLASASSDETVRLWDAGSGEAKQTLEGHSGWVRAVAFSPDGRLLASASEDETVRLWDAGSGEAKQTLEGHSGWVRAVAFSPDGRLLASASEDETVRLWDAGSGEAKQTLEGHSGWVRAVAFSPDGRLLASASEDETVRLWDAGSGEAMQTLKVDAVVYTLSFSNDGKFLQTNRGSLHITHLSGGIDAARPSLPLSVSVGGQWVSRGKDNILWLPVERRTSVIAVYKNVVAFGYRSGGVLIMEIAS